MSSNDTMHATLDVIIEKLHKLDDRGSTELANGTLLIRKNSPRADGLFSESYLHSIYGPLSDADLLLLEELAGKTIPSDLRAFYRKANGLSLFSNSLSIRGLRRDYSRSQDIRLPISLEYGNTLDKPGIEGSLDDLRSWVRFGFYPGGESRELKMKNDGSSTIHLTPRYKNGPSLHHWDSLSHFLLNETDRMIHEFNTRKGDVDFMNPLLPPEQAQVY